MTFDFRKLRGRIKETYGSEKAFAKEMGMAQSALSARLNNIVHFDGAETKRACDLLGIPDEEVVAYFYTIKFDFVEHRSVIIENADNQ